MAFVCKHMVSYMRMRLESINSGMDHWDGGLVSFLTNHALRSFFHHVSNVTRAQDVHRSYYIYTQISQAESYWLYSYL